MKGKIVVLILVISTILGGVSLYYLQVYYFYTVLDGSDPQLKVTVLLRKEKTTESIDFYDFKGIDADNSPLKYRSCFNIVDIGRIKSISIPVLDPVPITAPHWFPCFKAKDLGLDIEKGRVEVILSEQDIFTGIDRVLAFYPDGRAYSWHQLNNKYKK